MLTEYFVPAMMLAALSWANFHQLKCSSPTTRHFIFRSIVWGTVMALFAMCSLAYATANSAAVMLSQQDSNCLNSPECYARTHQLPSSECQSMIEQKAHFPLAWQVEKGIPTFNTFYWYDVNRKTVQMFGRQATTTNEIGMRLSVSYFCIFDANSGEIIAASFE